MAAATVNAAKERHSQTNNATINFTLNMPRVIGCGACDQVLHKTSHLFMSTLPLPMDYLTITKLLF